MTALIFIVVCASLEAQVPFGRILHADAEPGNWLTYSGDLGGKRYSPLTEINRESVSHLKVKWAHQFASGTNEVSPIVIDGVMYVTGPNTAAALDARTGRNLWDWSRPIPPDYRPVGFGQTSRGPAVLDDKLFVATLDGWLVALDIKSGAERWSTRVLDYKLGYSMTMAPLAIEGKVVVGISGGEAGIRGFIVREKGSRYFKRNPAYQPGVEFLGGGEDDLPSEDEWGAIRALQATTGEQRWEFKLHSPPWAGVMATAGGLVFSGSNEGNFYALDAGTGKPLWDFQTGGGIEANPIAFNVDGHECVAIAADRVLFVFSLD